MSKRSPVPFTSEDVNELLALLDGGAYDELEVETERFRLRLSRGEQGQWSQELKNLDPANPLSAAGVKAPAGSEQAASQPQQEVEGLANVPAPMGGVFYRAPNPGAPPFIEVGSRVEPGTVIGIIEVMKLMNSVRATVAGEVVEILPDNADFVSQGDTLLRVKAK